MDEHESEPRLTVCWIMAEVSPAGLKLMPARTEQATSG